MQADARDVDVGLGGRLALAALVASGLINVLRHSASFTDSSLAAVLALCAVYFVSGTSLSVVEWLGPRKFLVVQNLLGAGIVWLGRGNAVLVPLAAISQSGFVLGRRGTFAVAFAHAVNVLCAVPFYVGWSNGAGICIAFVAAEVFVIAFTDVAVRERRARTELTSAHRKLAEHFAQAEELATMQERNRLARELHDSLGHYLTVIHVQLQAAEGQLEQNPARAKLALAQAARLTHEGLEDVRRSVSALRASPMDQRPLSEAIGALVTELAASGVAARLLVTGDPAPLSPPAELALYRAAQEALTNVRKHAGAKRADVALEYLDKTVRLTVSDDGHGSEPASELGFGLLGVRERARLLRGELELVTSPGFTLKLSIPRGD